MTMLTLKCASKHRTGGPWSDDDYDVFDGDWWEDQLWRSVSSARRR